MTGSFLFFNHIEELFSSWMKIIHPYAVVVLLEVMNAAGQGITSKNCHGWTCEEICPQALWKEWGVALLIPNTEDQANVGLSSLYNYFFLLFSILYIHIVVSAMIC